MINLSSYGLDWANYDDEELAFHCDSRVGSYGGAWTTSGAETRARVYMAHGWVWLTFQIMDVPPSASSLTSVTCSVPNPDPTSAAAYGNIGVTLHWVN